ncbi:MAG: ABC transporter permease [bacterium]
MFRNYVKIALRNFARAKMFSLINLAGLIIGVTVSLHMLVYVLHESGYESFHQNRDRIYRIAVQWGSGAGKMKMAGSMPALAPAINAHIPEVQRAIRVQPVREAVIRNGAQKEFQESNLFFCDSGLFEIFSLQLVTGSGDEALLQPGTVILSESRAEKYFNGEDALGQIVCVLQKNPAKSSRRVQGCAVQYAPEVRTAGLLCDPRVDGTKGRRPVGLVGR